MIELLYFPFLMAVLCIVTAAVLSSAIIKVILKTFSLMGRLFSTRSILVSSLIEWIIFAVSIAGGLLLIDRTVPAQDSTTIFAVKFALLTTFTHVIVAATPNLKILFLRDSSENPSLITLLKTVLISLCTPVLGNLYIVLLFYGFL